MANEELVVYTDREDAETQHDKASFRGLTFCGVDQVFMGTPHHLFKHTLG